MADIEIVDASMLRGQKVIIGRPVRAPDENLLREISSATKKGADLFLSAVASRK